MAFMWEQRPRLLREENWNAQQLSQEIYAMISPDSDVSTDGNVQINANPKATVPPFVISGLPNDGSPAMQMRRSDGTVINFNNNGTVTSTPAGGTPQQVSGGGGGVPVWG